MVYPESVVLKELMWEYDYTEYQAQALIDLYKSNDKYSELCELIQHRLAMGSKEELYHVNFG